MSKSKLHRGMVEEARERAWQGEDLTAIASDLGVAYGPLWCAVRGKTFTWLLDPRPMPVGAAPVVKPPVRLCNNPLCRQVIKRKHGRYCQACQSFKSRNGRWRDPSKDGKGQSLRKHIPDLGNLIRRYQAGESFESLACGRSESAETIRRRFKELGLARRNSAGRKSALTAGLVVQAREMVYREGWRIREVARLLGVNYLTLYDAVRGITWAGAGGPLPTPEPERARPCRRCGLLADQDLCGFCRAESKGVRT